MRESHTPPGPSAAGPVVNALSFDIEDYFHAEGAKIALLLLMKAVAVVLAALAVLAVLKLALGA